MPKLIKIQPEGFPDTDVKRIIQNGFTRTEALEALESFNGNTDQALASLFAKALKF